MYSSARKYDYGRKTGDDDDDGNYAYGGYSAYGYGGGDDDDDDDDDDDYVFTGADGSEGYYLLQFN